jgi:hypothetical protein
MQESLGDKGTRREGGTRSGTRYHHPNRRNTEGSQHGRRGVDFADARPLQCTQIKVTIRSSGQIGIFIFHNVAKSRNLGVVVDDR